MRRLIFVPLHKGTSKVNRKGTYLRKEKHNSKLVEFNRKIPLCFSSFEPDTKIKERHQNLGWDKNMRQMPDFFW